SALIQQALLEPSQRQHPAAVAVELLGEFRDVVDCGTPTVTRNGTPVTCHLPAIVPPLAANATTIPGFDNSSPSAWAHAIGGIAEASRGISTGRAVGFLKLKRAALPPAGPPIRFSGPTLPRTASPRTRGRACDPPCRVSPPPSAMGALEVVTLEIRRA